MNGTERERDRDLLPALHDAVDATYVMRLPRTEDEYWARYLKPTRRNDVRRLSKRGVEVTETRDETVAETVYGLYRASFPRWGAPPAFVYPFAFYRNLLRLGGDAVRLTVARHGRKVIGGTFWIRWNGIVHYLAGYFDREARDLRPNVLIQIESVQRAIADGFRWYDFLPSGGRRSVEEFKEGLGGRRVEFAVHESRSWTHRLTGAIRRSSPER